MKIQNHLSGGVPSGVFPNTKYNRQAETKGNAEDLISKVKSTLESQKKNRTQSSVAGLQVSSYTDKNGNVHRTYTGTSVSVVDTMKKYATEKKKEKAKAKKSLQYNYYRVSSQIVSAKNSVNAAKAVLAARRGLAELKRKLGTVDCSEDEKQAALAHANQMLRIAKKKKKNLEMEELIHTTMQSDEKQEKMDAALESGLNQSVSEEAWTEEEETMKEDAEGLLDYEAENGEESLLDSMQENSEELSSEEDLDAITSELLEELQELSDEELDLMDMMEIVDPHMDKEQYEKLKTKHRCEEQKELVKADMEYLKAYIKSLQAESNHQIESGNMDAAGMMGVACEAEAPPTSLGFVCSL